MTGHQHYRTPGAFRRDLTTQSNRLAKERGLRPGDVRDWFFFQRLAARAFQDDPQGWLIVGGQALLIRYQGQSRMSRDIDLQYARATDLSEAYAALSRASARDLGDFLTFRLPPHPRAVEPDHTTQDVRLQVLIGTTFITTIRVDLTAGVRYTDPPALSELRPELPLLQEGVSWPIVRLAPTLGHLCDKICAMYARYGQDRPSSRVRDLVDVLLLAQQETFEGPNLYATLTQEVQRRRNQGLSLTLPATFRVPNPEWQQSYPDQARQAQRLHGCDTLEQAQTVAARFLDPVLASYARQMPLSGRWNADAGWHTPA